MPATPSDWLATDVRTWARWLLDRAPACNDFTTHYVGFPDGRPAVLPGLESAFRRDQSKPGLPPDAQFQRELLGTGMFHQRTRGTCTSTAIYLATTLRAAGLPTRLVLGTPLADGSDPAQIALVEKGLTLPALRTSVLRELRSLGGSYAAHTFNEVWLDGRWRRLNYTSLGDNITATFGLFTHLATVDDIAELPIAETWGRRYALGLRTPAFPATNPYRLLAVDDHWGPRTRLDRTRFAQASPRPLNADHGTTGTITAESRRHIPVSRLYWFHSPMRPSGIPADAPLRDRDGNSLSERALDGHLLLTADLSHDELQNLYFDADPHFTLVSAGGSDAPPVALAAERGFWGVECYLRIPAAELAKLRPGIAYRLVPRNQAAIKWDISEQITLTAAPDLPRAIPARRLHWFHSSTRPSFIPANAAPRDADGHLLLTANLTYDELERVYPSLDKRFTLVSADGSDAPSVPLAAERGFWDVECYLRIPAAELAKLRPGVAYRLEARNESPVKWQIPADLRLPPRP